VTDPTPSGASTSAAVAGAGDAEIMGLRAEAWDRATHATGTAHIFETRARQLRLKIAILTFFGIAVPAAVGVAAAGYGVRATFLPAVLSVAAALGGIQLLLSIWALARNWSGNLEGAARAFVANDQLAQRFQVLGKTPPNSAREMKRLLELAIVADDAQRQQDNLAGLAEREKRKGMRYALHRYQRRCTSCGLVPSNMRPTNCGVCGDF
jgi:mobilome CxxCx(11)CxxC protein